MEKKYQVFISSTYEDLKEERKKVQEILLMADCIPAGMEAFVATNDEQFNVIKKAIDLCDYYVLIIGGRYGSVNKSTGLSYTEMEYDYAVSKEIPVLVFSIDDSVELPEKKNEKDDEKKRKLVDFKSKAMNNRLANIWRNAADLAGQVAISIMRAKSEIERSGWVRGDDYNPTETLKKINKLQEENKALIKENASLKSQLDDLTKVDYDLEFEDTPLTISYKKSGTPHFKNLTIKEIFSYVSINMLGVAVRYDLIEKYIAKSAGASEVYELTDATIVKKICNQFVALKLMVSDWVEGKGLFYQLTTKGEKLRDEMNLIKRVTN